MKRIKHSGKSLYAKPEEATSGIKPSCPFFQRCAGSMSQNIGLENIFVILIKRADSWYTFKDIPMILIKCFYSVVPR